MNYPDIEKLLLKLTSTNIFKTLNKFFNFKENYVLSKIWLE